MKKHLTCECKDKKSLATEASIYILFGYIVLYPAFLILCSIIGYKFGITYPTIYSVCGVVIAVATVVLSFIFKDSSKTHTAILLCTLSPVIALIGTVIYVFNYPTLISMICMLLISVSCCILAFKSIKLKRDKIITMIAYSVSFVFVSFLSGMCLLFCNFGSDTVVKTVDAPDGSQYAEIISIDQGALGGGTVVDVNERNKNLSLLLFNISKKPNRVYIGEWGEFENMDVHFKNEECLVIDGTEYEIK